MHNLHLLMMLMIFLLPQWLFRKSRPLEHPVFVGALDVLKLNKRLL